MIPAWLVYVRGRTLGRTDSASHWSRNVPTVRRSDGTGSPAASARRAVWSLSRTSALLRPRSERRVRRPSERVWRALKLARGVATVPFATGFSQTGRCLAIGRRKPRKRTSDARDRGARVARGESPAGRQTRRCGLRHRSVDGQAARGTVEVVSVTRSTRRRVMFSRGCHAPSGWSKPEDATITASAPAR